MGVARGARGPWLPLNPSWTKTRILIIMTKCLPLRNYFFAGLLVSRLTKEKYITILLFELARVIMAKWQQSGIDVTSIIVQN